MANKNVFQRQFPQNKIRQSMETCLIILKSPMNKPESDFFLHFKLEISTIDDHFDFHQREVDKVDWILSG